MKTIGKNSVAILLAFFALCLFYKESVGVNVLIFTLLSVIGIIYLFPQLKFSRLVSAIVPTSICSIFMTVYPQALTFVVWLVSYIIMWSLVTVNLKPLLVPLQGLISIFESPFDKFMGMKNKEVHKIEAEGKKKNALIYVVTSAIVIVFVSLYSVSNPVISGLLDKINTSFIKFDFILMVVALYALLFGLIIIKKNQKLANFNKLKITVPKVSVSDKEDQEFKIGKLSIWIIASILSIVNLIDLFVLLTGELPDGVTYSEYVHQGFYTLILTMSLAIGLIIFFYRGQINFHARIVELQKSSYFWISQNLLLAMITAYKNILYVETYGLTYKRIAVFLCLVCIVIGLILSIKKIKLPLTNWYFFNKLALYAFISFVLISLMPFDMMITHYNLKYSDTKDLRYIMTLDRPDYHMIEEFIQDSNIEFGSYKSVVNEEIGRISQEAEKVNWQSWNLYLNTYKGVR